MKMQEIVTREMTIDEMKNQFFNLGLEISYELDCEEIRLDTVKVFEKILDAEERAKANKQ